MNDLLVYLRINLKNRLKSMRFCLGIICILMSVMQKLSSQTGITLDVRLIIAPILSSYFSDWERNPNQIRLSITNHSDKPVDVQIDGELKGQKTGLRVTCPSKKLSIRAKFPEYLFPKDILDFERIKFHTAGSIPVRVTRRLPDDNWQFCVQVRVLSTDQIFSTCEDFSLQFAVPPTLIYPQDKDTITTRYPLFQWNAASMQPGIRVVYYIKICEFMSGQNARQAIESNPIHFQQKDILTTSTMYPVAGIPFKHMSEYVWQIQAFDQDRNPLGDNEGKSEIWIFYYKEVR